MAGLFFCLASAEGAGLLFRHAAIQPHTNVYSGFYHVHAVIPPTPQNSAHGFIGAFPAICRVFSLLCGCASGYTAPPAPRWSVSQYRSTSTDTRCHRHTGRCTGQRSRPIIIRYIRARPLLWLHARQCNISKTMPARRGQLPPSADRWQMLRPAHLLRGQRLHLYRVSPAACSLAPGQRSERAFWHPPPGGAVQQERRNGRRGTIGGSRRNSFSGFRPIANRGQQ